MALAVGAGSKARLGNRRFKDRASRSWPEIMAAHSFADCGIGADKAEDQRSAEQDMQRFGKVGIALEQKPAADQYTEHDHRSRNIFDRVAWFDLGKKLQRIEQRVQRQTKQARHKRE